MQVLRNHHNLSIPCYTACLWRGNDRKEREAYGLAWRNMEEVRLLVMQTDEDCLAANRISLKVIEGLKQQGDKAPRLTAKVKQKISMNCLIAVSAAREGVIILTLNRHDLR